MLFLLTLVLMALASQVISAPAGSPKQCPGWSVNSLEHATGPKATFASNDRVTLKWATSGSKVTNIGDVGLYSAKDGQLVHTQYRSYPGMSAATGKLTFTLSVPLCLQRDGEYYLGVFSSTRGKDLDCYAQTPNFKLTPDPKGNYATCT